MRLPRGRAAAAAGLLATVGCADGAQVTPVNPLAAPSKRWRVINESPVTYGWKLGEVRFFSDTGCNKELTAPPAWAGLKEALESNYTQDWKVISSGSKDVSPDRALDGKTWTEWTAQCYICDPHEAWVGVEFAKPVLVRCIQVWQWGKGSYMSSMIAVQSLGKNNKWQDILRGAALQGGQWDTVKFMTCQALEHPDMGQVKTSNEGFYPSTARYDCAGVRLLIGDGTRACNADGSWTGGEPICLSVLNLVIIVVSVLVTESLFFCAYYMVIIRKKPPPLQATSFIPPEHVGFWTTDVFRGISEDQDVILCCLCCPCCRMADTWNMAGQMPFIQGAVATHCVCCLPCLGAWMRRRLRDRFTIRGTLAKDLVFWLLFIVCSAVQEAKHCDSLATIADEEVEVTRRGDLHRHKQGDHSIEDGAEEGEK